MISPLESFFGIEGHVTLDRNPGPGYNTLLLQLINVQVPNRQVHTLHCLLDSRAALPIANSYINQPINFIQNICLYFNSLDVSYIGWFGVYMVCK